MKTDVKIKLALALLVAMGTVVVVSLYISQCVVGDSNSITIQLESIKLLTDPTDRNFLGINIFGSPKDEIAVKVQCGICGATTPFYEIGKGDEISLHGYTVNTFFIFPFHFYLEESDGGLLGKNDLSKEHVITRHELQKIKKELDDDAEYIQLNYKMKVKGGDIFTETPFFGFISKHLCISAIDFVMGPFGKVVGRVGKMTLAMKALGMNTSGKLGKLLGAKAVGELYEQCGRAGIRNKKAIMKAVTMFQLKQGAMEAVKKPFKEKMSNYAIKYAKDQTLLDEEMKAIMDMLLQKGLHETGTKSIYDEGMKVVNKIGDVMADVTDALEFCLDEVMPPPRDAIYYLQMKAVRTQ